MLIRWLIASVGFRSITHDGYVSFCNMTLYIDSGSETKVARTVLMCRAQFLKENPIFAHVPLAGYDPTRQALTAPFILTDGQTETIYKILRSYER